MTELCRDQSDISRETLLIGVSMSSERGSIILIRLTGSDLNVQFLREIFNIVRNNTLLLF